MLTSICLLSRSRVTIPEFSQTVYACHADSKKKKNVSHVTRSMLTFRQRSVIFGEKEINLTWKKGFYRQ